MVLIGLGALLQIGGCVTAVPEPTIAAPRSGEVGVTDITRRVAFSSRVELANNETFLLPRAERGNALPVYPASLLAQALPPQSICLRVSIDTDGNVMASAPMVSAPDCPASGLGEQRFFAAAEEAVAGWRFDPAARCTFKDGKPADANSCIGADKVALAVSLAYRFVFEQHEGRGTVRISE